MGLILHTFRSLGVGSALADHQRPLSGSAFQVEVKVLRLLWLRTASISWTMGAAVQRRQMDDSLFHNVRQA
ncbi:hypothetical protein X740_17090 [Mesorhizobium sp. LNHC221B00]|nr:hypothetical protein X740_17090 [Mesorhizobium sp. LNHC221B00]